MEKVDVAIAGAGVAGCHAARELARAGHSVALVEKHARDELGHDWWDSIQETTFAEVGLPAPEPPELLGTSGPAKVYPPLETMELQAPARPAVLHIDRKVFAQRQLKYAGEAGAQIHDKTAVNGPIIEEGKVEGMVIHKQGGELEELRAKLVIDATGMAANIRSKMSEEFGFQRTVEREGTFVTHREIRKNTSDSREVVLVFGKDNGVRWVNRETEGLVDFFAGVINFENRPDPRDIVDEMVGNDGRCGPEILRGGYGAPIPVRHCFDSFVAPGLMLCGDSACQCNPLDGSGIASSLKAAHIAARVAHAALENNRFDAPALWPYNVEYKRSQGAKFVTLDAMQKFMVSEQKTNLEVLFRRRILKTEDFWGTGEAAESSKLEQLLQLLKLVDRPRFITRLVRAMTTAKELAAHYMDYPDEYKEKSFEDWRKKKRELFNRILDMYANRPAG